MYECVNCGGALRFDIPSQQLHCDHCDSDFDPQTYRVNESAGPGSYKVEVDLPVYEKTEGTGSAATGADATGSAAVRADAIDATGGAAMGEDATDSVTTGADATGTAAMGADETDSAAMGEDATDSVTTGADATGTAAMGADETDSAAAGVDETGSGAEENTAEKPEEPAATYSICVYTCPNCGGELLTTDESITGFCPYCGSFAMLTKKMRQETRPLKIIPFKKTKEDCKKAYKDRTARMLYTPRKMKDEDALETFRPIYMPFWMYDYTFDGDYKVVGTKEYTQGKYEITEIHRLTGQVSSSCRGISYDGSSSLDDEIAQAIIPYDTEDIQDFQPSYLCGFYADSADVSSKVYQDQADQFAMESMVERLGEEEAYKNFDTVRASGNKPKAKDLSMKKEPAKSVLLPMWFLTYRKGNRVAYSVVNGQTGKVTADLPVDIGRFLIGSLITAVPVFFLLNLFLAVIPRYLLALSGLPAMAVAATYMISVNRIYKRDFKLEDAGVKSLWTKGKIEEEEKKQEEVEKLYYSSVAGLVILAVLWAVCIFTKMRLDSALSSLVIIVAAGIMLFNVRSGRRHWDQKRLVNDSYVLLAALILSRILLLVNPHYDIYYYGGIIVLYLFILYTLIQLIREYNLMTTRPLPQLDRQGGDTSAPV